MAKPNSKEAIIAIVAVIVIALFGGQFGLFSTLVPDDYLIYDDFVTQDAALIASSQNENAEKMRNSVDITQVGYNDCNQDLSKLDTNISNLFSNPSTGQYYEACGYYIDGICSTHWSQTYNNAEVYNARRVCESDKWTTISDTTGVTYSGGDIMMGKAGSFFYIPPYFRERQNRIISKKDFSGMDLKFLVTLYDEGYSRTHCAADATVMGQAISWPDMNVKNCNRGAKEYLFEIKSSKLNTKDYEIFINGISKGVKTSDKLFVEIETGVHGSLKVSDIKYKPTFRCVTGSNELLAMETFAAGSEIGIYSTRYPVKSYCLDNPVIITSSEGSTQTAEPYQQWLEGKTLNVPLGQTWTVFYVLSNDGSIPTTCSSGAYDVVNEKCTDVTGIVQICSQGQFDPETGLCVVQPESTFLCPDGGRYDVAQNKCVYNPPLQYVCATGDYNSVSGKCEIVPAVAEICEDNTVYNPLTKYCESFPSSQIVCDPFYAYDVGLDKCVREPELENLCLSGGYYSETADKCVKELETEYACNVGALEYDNGIYTCVYSPEYVAFCDEGIYDSVMDKCVYTPEVEAECISGATYSSVDDKCIYEPDITCLQGTYDNTKDACVYEPNLRYLCINGEIKTDSNGKQYCEVRPPSVIVCEPGCSYNEAQEQCVCTAGTDEPQVVIVDSEGKIDNYQRVNDDYSWVVWIAAAIVIVAIFFETGPKRGFIRKK